MTEKRPYTLKARAQSRDQTRRRIVEAAMALHEEIGPRATTLSAIAARAGVQRLTLYRHFPDETAIYRACTSHWLALNPPPRPSDWQRPGGGPAAERAVALAAFNAYYARTRRMLAASHRDAPEVPALQAPMREQTDYVAGVARALAPDLGPLAAATLAHALAFPTWEALEARGLDNAAKLRLALAWIAGAAAADAAG